MSCAIILGVLSAKHLPLQRPAPEPAQLSAYVGMAERAQKLVYHRPTRCSMAFSTAKLDQLLEERSQRDEAERQALVNKLLQWLDVHGTQCAIRKAYLFGSLAQPYRFHQQSDIDIAIQPDHPVDLFALISI